MAQVETFRHSGADRQSEEQLQNPTPHAPTSKWRYLADDTFASFFFFAALSFFGLGSRAAGAFRDAGSS